jgi:putative copper export protein
MSLLEYFASIKTLHLLFASLWTGGIILTVVINRALRRTMPATEATKTLGVIGRSIQKTMRYSLYLAIVTGLLLLLTRGVAFKTLFDPIFYTTRFGAFLLGKIIAVLIVLALLPLHSRLGERIYMTNSGADYRRLRLGILLVGWATLGFTIVAIIAGTWLRLS